MSEILPYVAHTLLSHRCNRPQVVEIGIETPWSRVSFPLPTFARLEALFKVKEGRKLGQKIYFLLTEEN